MRHRSIAIATLAASLIGSGLVATPLHLGTTALHAAEEGHKHGKGEKHKLGRQTIGNYTVSVILIGEVEPGEHVDFDIKLIDAKTDPKALRVWIGTADAAGSEKATGTKGATTYTGEVNAPKPLPAGSKLWVELETEDGTKSGSFAIEESGHKH